MNLILSENNSVENKTVIVTGANSGIGFEIANGMALRGAKVIIACRDNAKGIEAQKQINRNSEYINLDLGSFASIEAFTNFVKEKYTHIDILVNNAGVLWPTFSQTHDRLELTFGVNYVGPYVLTNKIMPLLRETRGSRIVHMSSIAQYRVKHIDWDNINSEKYYSKTGVYNLSNLYRMMFALELEDRLRGKKYETISLACHPGVTITNLQRHMRRFPGYSILRNILNYTIFHPPDKAAMPALAAATSRLVNGGDFIGLDSKRQFKGKPKVVQPNPLALNKENREKLWAKSVEFTGIDLE